MSTPPLMAHGQHVKPHYTPPLGQVNHWAGKSTDAERPDGNASGIVKRYKMHKRASDKPLDMGLIDTCYAQAISYTAKAHGLRGLAFIAGLLGAGFSIFFAFFTAPEIYFWPTRSALDIPLWFFPPLFFALGVFFIVWTIRLEFFRPLDEPTIFDRQHRKVYRFFCEAQPGLKGLFQPWPMRACEYDWDLIDVEHNATLVTTGATVRREHALIFMVRRSADDPTIIDSFTIGNALILVLDDAVDAAWEHIRRFMEEGGAHLTPGESLPTDEPVQSLWQRLRNVTPLSRNYWLWWREQLPLMLLAHALLPLSVVFIGLWIFFGWLSVKTSRPVEWPAEVLEALGPVSPY
nr:DUF6708 domain-containing protein [uncultured Albidiferax sp.]